jgi:hypothetical protein
MYWGQFEYTSAVVTVKVGPFRTAVPFTRIRRRVAGWMARRPRMPVASTSAETRST